MNAGKSTSLLQANHNYNDRGMKTILFTPNIDDRYKKGVIHSRIGLKADAIVYDKDSDLFAMIENLLPANCVLIDEAQFLTKKQVLELSKAAVIKNIPVLAYGLRTDYMGEPFPGSTYLLAYAEELIEIKTVCHCGSKATMNIRVDENNNRIKQGQQIHIGGNESYKSCCRKHFFNYEV
jgi:thymidine kinase